MRKLMFIIIPCLLCACEKFKIFQPAEAEGPPPLKIEKVIRCNKYKTCVVVFTNGKQGLMTSPKEGEYGCQSMRSYSYNRCPGP